MWGKDGIIKPFLPYWHDVKCINGKKCSVSPGNMNTPRKVSKKGNQRHHVSHTLMYFLGFQNWFYTGRNQSCHVKLTMIWWHFHATAAYASDITPEQTAILAQHWSHTAVLFNPVCGKSLLGKWVAEIDVRQKVCWKCFLTDEQSVEISCLAWRLTKWTKLIVEFIERETLLWYETLNCESDLYESMVFILVSFANWLVV